jgi:hypothetical protein
VIQNDCWGTLKEGVAFPKGSRGSLRSRSWEQNIDQRESSEAKDLNLLLRQAALAESLGPNFLRIVCRTRSSSASRPISFFHYFSLSLSLSLPSSTCSSLSILWWESFMECVGDELKRHVREFLLCIKIFIISMILLTGTVWLQCSAAAMLTRDQN